MTAPVEGESTLTHTLISTVETLIADAMRDQQVPGFAIGIVKDGQRVYGRGFGVAGVESQQPITTQSLFLMASVSKAFTATAILQLIEAGKIRLEAPVTDYLPYFQLADKRYTDISIRHLLTHTSGLGFWPPFEGGALLDYWRKATPEFDDDALEHYVRGLRELTLPFAPGHGYSYSDRRRL